MVKHYRCPKCGRDAIIIKEFRNGVIAVKCPHPHYHGIRKKWGKEEKIYKRNEVFLIDLERENFERMMRKVLRSYFSENMEDLLTGNIIIEDDGRILRIKKKNETGYDVGIVY